MCRSFMYTFRRANQSHHGMRLTIFRFVYVRPGPAAAMYVFYYVLSVIGYLVLERTVTEQEWEYISLRQESNAKEE